MNIVHTEASCGWGGQEIRILEESRGLIERGHAVCVLCPPESRIYEEGPKRGVPTIALPIARKNLKGLLALRHWLRHNPVDVLNTHSSTVSWLAAMACQTLNNAPPIVRTRHIASPIPDNWASRWLYTKAVRHVVTTGEALRQQVIEQTGADPARVTSVPTGIDPERFKPGDKQDARRMLGLDPDSHYIGIVATLRSWKGHMYLLEAFAQINAPSWKLLIVGDGPQRENIQAKVHELGISKDVFLAGQQNNPEDWLRALDIFCLPSYANEGVPQSIMQAMLTGLPIVSTNIGAISEAINNDNGIIVQTKNSQSIAIALHNLTNNENTRNQFGNQALVDATSKHCSKQMIERMEAIFYNASKLKHILLVTFGDRNTASTRLRVLDHIPYLDSGGFTVRTHYPIKKSGSWIKKTFEKRNEYSSIIKAARDAGIVIVQKRLLPPIIISKIKKSCHRIIYDFDDAITTSQHKKFSIITATRTQSRFKAICKHSVAIIAGNRYLASRVDERYRNKVHILQTAVNKNKYDPQANTPRKSVIIGWIGQPTNYPYIKDLENVFSQLTRIHPETELLIISKGNPEIRNIKTTLIPWSEETEAESLSNIDIGIMPMPDNEWTRGKCAFKALQYMASGIPVICSDVGGNKEVVRNGIDGFVVKRQEEWLNTLLRLIEDSKLRAQMGQSGRNSVETTYDISQISPRFIDILNESLACK